MNQSLLDPTGRGIASGLLAVHPEQGTCTGHLQGILNAGGWKSCLSSVFFKTSSGSAPAATRTRTVPSVLGRQLTPQTTVKEHLACCNHITAEHVPHCDEAHPKVHTALWLERNNSNFANCWLSQLTKFLFNLFASIPLQPECRNPASVTTPFGEKTICVGCGESL